MNSRARCVAGSTENIRTRRRNPFPYGRTERPVDGSQRYARAFFGVVLNTVISLRRHCRQRVGNGRGAPRHAVCAKSCAIDLEWRSQNAGFARRQYQNLPRCRLRKKRSNAAGTAHGGHSHEPLINRLRSIPESESFWCCDGPALVVFSGKKVLIYDRSLRQYLLIIQLLNSENMHKSAIFYVDGMSLIRL